MNFVSRHHISIFFLTVLVWITFNSTYYQNVDLTAIPDMYRIMGLAINGSLILTLGIIVMRHMKAKGYIFVVYRYKDTPELAYFSGNERTLMQNLVINTDFEFIKYAAVRHPNGNIFAVSQPGRHGDVKMAMDRVGMAGIANTMDQGFVTSKGRFVNREEGLTIAKDRRQIVRKHPTPDELYSEDMWPE